MFVYQRWQKCVGVASSDEKGFGMAAGHAYIKEKFDDESRQVVSRNFKQMQICIETSYLDTDIISNSQHD